MIAACCLQIKAVWRLALFLTVNPLSLTFLLPYHKVFKPVCVVLQKAQQRLQSWSGLPISRTMRVTDPRRMSTQLLFRMNTIGKINLGSFRIFIAVLVCRWPEDYCMQALCAVASIKPASQHHLPCPSCCAMVEVDTFCKEAHP